MKHVIAIPELAQRLGVDAQTAEELARDVGALSWTESMEGRPAVNRAPWSAK
jgi:hypothetical protein